MNYNCHIIKKITNVTIEQIHQISNRLRGVVKHTPLELNTRLSDRYGANVYLKREDLQIPRSFKIRGSYHKILNIYNLLNSYERKNLEIVCASAGNHAQGVALSCKKLKIPCTIYLPDKTPLQKVNRIHHFSDHNSNIKLYGDTFNECLEEALRYQKKNSAIFVHPYNDYDVILGQATIADEIYQEIEPDMIISAIGGGGLISGISTYSKKKSDRCKIIGVEPDTCPSMQLSILNNEIIKYPVTDNFVDGATVSEVGDITYALTKKYTDSIINCNTGKICETLLELYTEDGIISEPAGALSISALDQLDIKGKNVVCILSGGNNDISRYPEIKDRMLSYKDLKHYYLIEFAQRPGELKTFINNILGPNDDIVRFEYVKKTNLECGNVLIGIELEKAGTNKLIEQKLKQYSFQYMKLDENNILYNYLV